VLGLALPVAAGAGQSAPTSDVAKPAGQTTPAPDAATVAAQSPFAPDAPADAAPYTLAWSERVAADTDHLIWTSDLAISTSPTVGIEARTSIDGHIAWTKAVERVHIVAASGDVVVIAAGERMVQALEAKSGAERWAVSGDRPVRTLTALPAIVLAIDDVEIRALDVRDGAVLWRVATGAAPATALSIDGAFGAVGLSDNTLVALDVAAGGERWRFPLDHVALAVTAGRGRVFVGTADGTICALGQTAGRVDWRRLASVPVAGDPVTDERYLYVARLDSTLKRYDASRGTLLESVTLPSRPIAGVRLAGDGVAVALASGTTAFITRSRPAHLTRLIPAVPPRLDAMLTSADAAIVLTLGITDGARTVMAYRRTP